jgi:hypothetical protein
VKAQGRSLTRARGAATQISSKIFFLFAFSERVFLSMSGNGKLLNNHASRIVFTHQSHGFAQCMHGKFCFPS